MMIHKTQTGSTVTLALSGKLDSVTQSELAQELEKVFETGMTGLVFDLSALEYISSAGLRVLLSARKKVKALGATMKIVGASESVKEIFQITGFTYDD
jgi:anti-sigma B factor antagonist